MHHWLPAWHQLTWLWGGERQGGSNGTGYLITSGPLGDLFIIGGILAILKRHNCHVRGCFRLQWKMTRAGDAVCRRHHPEEPKSHAQIVEDHRAASGSR